LLFLAIIFIFVFVVLIIYCRPILSFPNVSLLFFFLFWNLKRIRPFQYTRYDGLVTHAMQWIVGAKYLSPLINPIDLVSTIIQQNPIPLNNVLRGCGPRDTNELLSVLTEFEESTSFCEQRHDEHRPHHTNNLPNPQNERREQGNRQGYRGWYNWGHQQRNQPTAPVVAPIYQLKYVRKLRSALPVISVRNESPDTSICNQPLSSPTDFPERTVQRPELQVNFFKMSTPALLDSGASISAVSEQFFATLKSQAPTPSKLSTLPITRVTISTAIQSRSKKTTRQVYVPLSVFGHEAPGIFLVVPHLSTNSWRWLAHPVRCRFELCNPPGRLGRVPKMEHGFFVSTRHRRYQINTNYPDYRTLEARSIHTHCNRTQYIWHIICETSNLRL
jgi:hypothetical protein